MTAEAESTGPSIDATPTSLTGFTYIVGNGPSVAQTISVSGENLTANIGLSLGASSNYEMSLASDGTYSSSLSLTPTSGAVAATTVYVRLKAGLAVNASYSGIITLTSTGADDVAVSLSGSVTNQTYTLTDESGSNGSIAFSASPVEAGTHVVLTPTPASDAYFFVADSWSFFDDDTNEVTDDIDFVTGETNTIVMPAYNLHVDATFAAKPTYDVVYDCNGGTSGCPADLDDVIAGTSITLPAAPTYAGHIFNGWNDGTTTYDAGDSYTVNDDTYFTAQWTPGGVGTINFGTATGSFNFNATDTSAEDNLGNTWKVDVQGTTSYTTNSAFIQVGSKSSPATSITFAMKLSSMSTFTAFSAKFGGFSNTAGTVNLKVYNSINNTETTVGSGSLNEDNDVTVSNSSTAVGDSLTVTVTNIARGVKCYYVSYTYSTSSDPIISAPNTVNLGSLDTNAEFDYSIINPASGVSLSATSTNDWISNISVTSTKVTFETTPNTSTTDDRTGTITLSYTGAENKTVIVTQSKVDYATLPFTYDGNGVYQVPNYFETNLSGSYTNSPKMKFDDAGKYLILHLNEAPTSLSYDIKGNGSGSTPWAGTFKVQTSADGETWADLATYTTLGDKQTITHIDLAATVRYIKWVYTTKSTGNVALGNIKASANYDIYGSVTATSLTVTSIQSCVIYNGGLLEVTGTLANTGSADNFVIQDGGQLICNNNPIVTVQKSIDAAANWSTASQGWYFIASPLSADYTPAGVMIADDFDLYRLNPTKTDKAWENYKNSAEIDYYHFDLTNGRGYLYANNTGNDLSFTGAIKPYDANHSIPVSQGWNLVGNPYTFDAYANVPYYAMNEEGTGITANTIATSTAVKPCTGIVINADDGGTIKFLKEAPSGSANNGNIQLTLAQTVATRGESSVETLDNAIVSFNEGCELEKFYFGEQDANIFIPQGNEEYAIVSAEAQGEMPVCFKAKADGQYTISVDAENVEMSYLHLIDNITGADVDLLANPSYTFNAKGDDYASRFKLVFSANNNVSNAENGNFAFISNGQIILNGVSNDATIQVIDMLGRVVSSQTVNGNSTHMAPTASGVYVLRLIDGTNVMTQKIVVK